MASVQARVVSTLALIAAPVQARLVSMIALIACNGSDSSCLVHDRQALARAMCLVARVANVQHELFVFDIHQKVEAGHHR